jgi:hypothetical protein
MKVNCSFYFIKSENSPPLHSFDAAQQASARRGAGYKPWL